MTLKILLCDLFGCWKSENHPINLWKLLFWKMTIHQERFLSVNSVNEKTAASLFVLKNEYKVEDETFNLKMNQEYFTMKSY